LEFGNHKSIGQVSSFVNRGFFDDSNQLAKSSKKTRGFNVPEALSLSGAASQGAEKWALGLKTKTSRNFTNRDILGVSLDIMGIMDQ